MTVSAPRSRRPSARSGWWFVLGGFLIQAPAAAGAIYVSDVFIALSLLGGACVGVGAYLLRGKFTAWLCFGGLFGAMAMAIGVTAGGSALAKDLWGRTATCQVDSVLRQVTTETDHDSQGHPTFTRTVVFYAHTLTCPDRTYTVRGARPRPEGSAVEVRYDPRGSSPPEFVDEINTGAVSLFATVLTVGVVVEILLTIVAWRRGLRGRRLAATGPPPQGPSGPPPAAYPPSPAVWRSPPPVPLESPRFEQAIRDSAPAMRPESQIALPLIVRLLRRRMGVQDAPPPNPLAGKYPEHQPPPPQGPPVPLPPPPDPYGQNGPYGQRRGDAPDR